MKGQNIGNNMKEVRRIYGVYDIKQHEMCVATGTIEELRFTFFKGRKLDLIMKAIKNRLLIDKRYEIIYLYDDIFDEVVDKLDNLTIDDFCLSTPGFDIRCMQHENLYSRLYMS